MKHWALFTLGIGAFAFVGCNIEINEHPDDWHDWDEDSIEERAADVCEPYCLRLINCDVLGDSSFTACVDLCIERYIEDEDRVREGCTCVSSSSCDLEEVKQCDGDPIPGVWTDDDDDLDPDGGDGDGDDNGAGGAPNDDVKSCKVNHDCATGEDCIDKQCLPRCVASCQCSDGQACEDGYCKTPMVPATACETSCDCTSGEDCKNGFCE